MQYTTPKALTVLDLSRVGIIPDELTHYLYVKHRIRFFAVFIESPTQQVYAYANDLDFLKRYQQQQLYLKDRIFTTKHLRDLAYFPWDTPNAELTCLREQFSYFNGNVFVRNIKSARVFYIAAGAHNNTWHSVNSQHPSEPHRLIGDTLYNAMRPLCLPDTFSLPATDWLPFSPRQFVESACA